MADMGSSLDRFAEVETGEAFTLQNPRLLKVELSETSVMARNGAMVAYQGEVRFEHKGGGVGRLLKKAATGEQLRLMTATGTGEVFLAEQAMLVHVLRRGVVGQRDLAALRWILYGGEPFEATLLRELMELLPGARVSNVYGPAEVNQCTFHHLDAPPRDGEPVPIGRPFARSLSRRGGSASSTSVWSSSVSGPTPTVW